MEGAAGSMEQRFGRVVLWTAAFVVAAVGGLIYLFAQTRPPATAFDVYANCRLPNGPSVVETAPFGEGLTGRTVDTIKGPRQVPISDGRRVMFAYPGEDFYANVKVEIVPAESWAESKIALSDNFDYLLASSDNERNHHLGPEMNGFTVLGLDRKKREGGVLGIYLLFEEATHTVITIYFLNQEPPVRFKTMDEYGILRDRFLADYTACIRKTLAGHR
jgi:hypothetical protein